MSQSLAILQAKILKAKSDLALCQTRLEKLEAEAATLIGIPTPGTMMKDGTIFVGKLPHSDVTLYAMPEDILGWQPWESAMQLGKKLIFAGHADWRLPTSDEFYLLYRAGASIRGLAADHYWTSTEQNDRRFAWCQNPANGHWQALSKLQGNRVRLVRTE